MRHRMKKSIFAVLLLALLMTGCEMHKGSETEENKETKEDAADALTPKDENLIVVGVSQVGSESVWRTANTASIQKAFTKEKGYFLIFENARQKQENQIKAIRSFISQQVDYIVFSPIMEDGWETVLQEAKDAGIPVILMDRMVNVNDGSLYTSWVGSDFMAEGRNAGQWLNTHLEAQGRQEEELNIVVLQGTAGSTSVIGRTEGFNEVAEQHPNWKILEQVDADFTTAKGREEMKKMLSKYEDIDVVVSQNDDMTFGAIEAIQEAGFTTGGTDGMIVISFDATKAALEMVEKGIINVDIECNPNQGEYVEKVVRMLGKGEQAGKTFYVPEEIFTKENVGSVLADRTY